MPIQKTKPKRRKAKVAYSFDQSGVLTVALRKQKDDELTSYSLGGAEAKLSRVYLKNNPQLLKQIVLFGEHLAKQLRVDGVRIRSINFGTINFK